MALFRARAIKQGLLGAVALALGLATLSGCDSSGYSPDMRYPPRTDPLYKSDDSAPTDELQFPDQPGQLPVLSMAQARNPLSPLAGAAQGNKLLDPRDLQPQLKAQLDADLEKVFGTPASPRVAGISPEATQVLKLDEATLAEGSRLYRIQCLHCHGMSGDGRGPTGFWVNPHPRDYRQGLFKFVSTDSAANSQIVGKPRREDLLRTLRQGIDGTSMPSFGLLPNDELEAIVSYVIHLSLRGQAEFNFIRLAMTGGDQGTPEMWVQFLTEQQWLPAQNSIMKPGDPGFDLFPFLVKDPNTNEEKEDEEKVKKSVQGAQKFFVQLCATCHTDYGRKSKFRYDVWGTLVRPADLTTGLYRGGRRPIDFYWRIRGGIAGSGMLTDPVKAEVEKAKTEKRTPLVTSIWDVVKFVEILPYPQMRAKYGIQID